ncbi:MAG TPA: hypothetical protein VK158_05695 [Acidobacteriota bacterium]|nr:hypothetical protein [Acidobacteriota bacterium]
MRASAQTIFTNVKFSHTETFLLIVYSFVVGFLVSFDNWGKPFDYSQGISNLVLAFILALLVTFVFVFAQKTMGFLMGVTVESVVSWKALLLSVLIAFASRGSVVFFLPPGIISHLKPFSMIGRRPYQFSVRHLSAISLFSVGAMSLLAIIGMNVPLADFMRADLFLICFLTALYALIPIEFFLTIFHFMTASEPSVHVTEFGAKHEHAKPVSMGSLLLYGSRTRYVFALILVAASSIALFTSGIIFAFLFAVFVATLGMIVYFLKSEI